MECAVCYSETGPFRKLCCGHEFCGGCIKQWYMKGAAGASCPMCRAPVYFKGFHAVRDEWAEEQWRTKCAETIDEYRTSRIEEAFEFASVFGPRWRRMIMNELAADLKDLDRTARFLVSEGYDAETIDYVLFETDEYFSDRRIGKAKWIDEPVKQQATRYPKMAKRGR